MQLLHAPTQEPVSVDEAKLAARISDTIAFDAQVPGLIVAARQLAEQGTGLKLMQQTWRAELVDWPECGEVFHLYQVTAVAISYWTGSVWANLAGSAFAFGAVGNGTGLAPAIGTSWPVLGDKPVGPRVRIDLTAGVTDAGDVPECIKLYIKALVTWWIENPSAGSPGSMQEAPFLSALLDPVRLWG